MVAIGMSSQGSDHGVKSNATESSECLRQRTRAPQPYVIKGLGPCCLASRLDPPGIEGQASTALL